MMKLFHKPKVNLAEALSQNIVMSGLSEKPQCFELPMGNKQDGKMFLVLWLYFPLVNDIIQDIPKMISQVVRFMGSQEKALKDHIGAEVNLCQRDKIGSTMKMIRIQVGKAVSVKEFEASSSRFQLSDSVEFEWVKGDSVANSIVVARLT